MLKFYSLLLVFFVSSSLFAQKNLVYKGKIGNYPILFEMDSYNKDSSTFIGKYKYAKSKSFLKLNGTYSSPVLYAEEMNGETPTGVFYLEFIGDSIVGSWIGNNNSLKVALVYKSGNKNLLYQKSEEELNKNVSDLISGKYQVNYNFINDMWVNEENLEPEIGYNGGTISIAEQNDGSILFNVEMICGPTYHFAMAEGIAVKQAEKYIYKNDDGCEISFEFKNKKVIAVASNSMDCGFGARAYLDHELFKVHD